MKHLFLLFLFPWCLVATLSAQSRNGSVEGVVADSSGLVLPAATVVLLQQKDSVLVSFGVTDNDGHFAIKKVEPGNYTIQITYLGYQSWYQNFAISPEHLKHDLGRIRMVQSNTLLNGVDITAQKIPLSIRKDTINYNAGAFKTQPGAVVEDLLKKLPGIQVQSDGTIKAQGETVRSVLVEGKEFFGNDPKIATKNLPADAVDKVQLYNKKSDKAEFTGIEDGQHQKTINLQLKEDRKQGYFGNIKGGYGTSDRFDGRFNINRFAKKTQMSAIGIANNTNQEGFSFDDYINFMGGLSNIMGGSGGGGRMRISLNPQDAGIPLGLGLENGLTRALAGGLNFNQEIGSKTNVSANYFYNNIRNVVNRQVSSENVLDNSQYSSTEQEDRTSQNAGHRLNLTVKQKLDSSQNMIFRGRLQFNDAFLQSSGQSASFNAKQTAENTGTRDYMSDGSNLQGNFSLVYRRRFGGKGRSLVADASYQVGNDKRSGDLLAFNNFLATVPAFSQTIHQRQRYLDDANNYSASLAYTEPLGKRQYLEWQVSHQSYANGTNKDYYDIDTPTPGENFNPLLSSHYKRGYQYNRAGMNYLLNRKKFNLTAGAAWQQSKLDGTLADSSKPPLSQTYYRVLPSLFFHYDFQTGRNLGLEYTTSLREPSLEQLLPVVDNNDPLNTYTGNPNLKPEYTHSLALNFMNFDQFSMTSIFASLNASYTKDKITNAGMVDSLLRRNFMPVNVKRDVQLSSYLNYQAPIRFLKARVNVSLNSSYDRGILFVNSSQNNTDRWQNTAELSFENRKKDKVDFSIGARLTWNSTRYSVNSNLNAAYLKQDYFSDLTIFPTKKWTLASGIDLALYSKEAFGASRAVPLWRASIARYILKNNKGQIKLSAADLLNRNIGITRTSQLNYIQEERIRNLGRYVMLTFAYSISGFNAAQQGGGLHINMMRRN
jgi:hypothetical protein